MHHSFYPKAQILTSLILTIWLSAISLLSQDIYQVTSLDGNNFGYISQFISHQGKLFFNTQSADSYLYNNNDLSETSSFLHVYDGSTVQNVRLSEGYPSISLNYDVLGSQLVVLGSMSPPGKSFQPPTDAVLVYDGVDWKVCDTYVGFTSLSFLFNTELIEYDGKLYFTAESPEFGREIYVYDGTEVTVLDQIVGSASSFPADLVVFQDRLLFNSRTAAVGAELFSFDGTSIQLVEDLLPGTGFGTPNGLTVYQGALYFSANSGDSFRLHRYDGATIQQLSTNNMDDDPIGPGGFISYNGFLYFSATHPSLGRELYQTDGTNIEFVEDLIPGPEGSSYTFNYSGPEGLMFTIRDPVTSDLRFIRLFNNSTSELSLSTITDAIVYEGELFATGCNDFDCDLYIWDEDEFELEFEITGGDLSAGTGELVIYDENLFYSGRLDRTTYNLKIDLLYQSLNENGSAQGFLNGADVSIQSVMASSSEGLRVFARGESDLIQFGIHDFDNGELTLSSLNNNFIGENRVLGEFNNWIYDDENISAFPVFNNATDLVIEGKSPAYEDLRLTLTVRSGPFIFNDDYYFIAREANSSVHSFWIYDGSDITKLDLQFQGAELNIISNEAIFDDNIIIIDRSQSNSRLFSYDGSTVTQLGTLGSNFSQIDLIEFDDKLYFIARSASGTFELFEYGTSLNSIHEFEGFSSLSNMTIFDDKLLILYREALFEFDGTTVEEKSTPFDCTVDFVGAYNGLLFLNAYAPSTGAELWSYDGDNFSLYADIYPGVGNGHPTQGTLHDGKFYLTANNGISGRELFVLDIDDCPFTVAVGPTESASSRVQASRDIEFLPSANMISNSGLTLSARESIELMPSSQVPNGKILNVDNVGCP